MKSSYRIFALIAAMLILIALNLWQWGSDSKETTENHGSGNLVSIDDFKVKRSNLPINEERDVVRNLFNPLVREPVRASHDLRANDAGKKKYQRLVAERELDNFKLAGILTRGSRREGFLINGENSYRVGVGDKAGERFIVKRISDDAVYLVDPATKVSGVIRLSGY